MSILNVESFQRNAALLITTHGFGLFGWLLGTFTTRIGVHAMIYGVVVLVVVCMGATVWGYRDSISAGDAVTPHRGGSYRRKKAKDLSDIAVNPSAESMHDALLSPWQDSQTSIPTTRRASNTPGAVPMNGASNGLASAMAARNASREETVNDTQAALPGTISVLHESGDIFISSRSGASANGRKPPKPQSVLPDPEDLPLTDTKSTDTDDLEAEQKQLVLHFTVPAGDSELNQKLRDASEGGAGALLSASRRPTSRYKYVPTQYSPGSRPATARASLPSVRRGSHCAGSTESRPGSAWGRMTEVARPHTARGARADVGFLVSSSDYTPMSAFHFASPAASAEGRMLGPAAREAASPERELHDLNLDDLPDSYGGSPRMWPMEVVEEEAVALALTGDLAWSTWKGASEGAARMLIHTITGGPDAKNLRNRSEQAVHCLEVLQTALRPLEPFERAQMEESMVAAIESTRPIHNCKHKIDRWVAVRDELEAGLGPYSMETQLVLLKEEWRALLHLHAPINTILRMRIAEAGLKALTKGDMGPSACSPPEPLNIAQRSAGARAAVEAVQAVHGPYSLSLKCAQKEAILSARYKGAPSVRAAVAQAQIRTLKPTGARREKMIQVLSALNLTIHGEPKEKKGYIDLDARALTVETALAKLREVMAPFTEEERLQMAEAALAEFEATTIISGPAEQLAVSSAILDVIKKASGGQLSDYQRMTYAETYLVGVHSAESLTFAQQIAHLHVGRAVLEQAHPMTEEVKALVLEAGARALIEFLEPEDTIMERVMNVSRQKLEEAVGPATDLEEAHFTEAMIHALLVAASHDPARLQTAQRALLSLRSSNTRAAGAEERINKLELAVQEKQDRVRELEAILQNTLVADGKAISLNSVQARIIEAMGNSKLYTSMEMVLNLIKKVLHIIHEDMSLNVYISMEAYDEMVSYQEQLEMDETVLNNKAKHPRLQYMAACDLLRDTFMHKKLDPDKCKVSYLVFTQRQKVICPAAPEDLEVYMWGGRSGRTGDFAAFPLLGPGPAHSGMCMGVLGVDTLSRSMPKGIGHMEQLALDFAATRISTALCSYLGHQASQVTECIEMTRLSARTWSERMLKIVALSSKRAQIENILHGADDHEMCVSEIDVREQPDSRILASCLAVLLLIGKMHLRQKVIDAVGSFRIPLDDHGMWRTLWKDVLQPSMHELAANGIGCIARAMRDVTISTQDCLLTNTDVVTILAECGENVHMSRSTILRTFFPWAFVVSCLVDLQRQQSIHAQERNQAIQAHELLVKPGDQGLTEDSINVLYSALDKSISSQHGRGMGMKVGNMGDGSVLPPTPPGSPACKFEANNDVIEAEVSVNDLPSDIPSLQEKLGVTPSAFRARSMRQQPLSRRNVLATHLARKADPLVTEVTCEALNDGEG